MVRQIALQLAVILFCSVQIYSQTDEPRSKELLPTFRCRDHRRRRYRAHRNARPGCTETNHLGRYSSKPSTRYLRSPSAWMDFERRPSTDSFTVANHYQSKRNLELGSVAEVVEVTSEAPMLDASTATVTAALTTKQIGELPMITTGRKRDITSFLQFLPGVTTASTWGARVNGSNPGNSEVFLDGAPASQGNVRGGIQENGPAVEQVGEFSVVTNAFNAEYGRTGSWFTNITIKSGTNEIHGSVYDYLNNTALNARSFFQSTRTQVKQNEGGFTLGGPVFIPKFYDGRNKTFFFFGQQLVFYNQSASGGRFTSPRSVWTGFNQF